MEKNNFINNCESPKFELCEFLTDLHVFLSGINSFINYYTNQNNSISKLSYADANVFNFIQHSNSIFEPYLFILDEEGFSLFIPSFVCGVFALFLHKKISENAAMFVITFWSIVSFFSTLLSLYGIFDADCEIIKLFDVINVFDFNISLDILIDPLTATMVFVVNFISFCVITFAGWYMKGDPNFLKFIAYLNFFTFFMLILVTANNLVLIFVGWEGIGLFSYFLINFWNTRLNANRSALKAIILNKIGDLFFYLFIFSYFFLFDTIQIYEVKCLFNSCVYDHAALMQTRLVHLMVFSIILASMAKSAQVILHVWLPDAMEGPTPVSALLHAATMVTAGIYILIKFNWILFYSQSVYCFIILVGIFTNLLASLVALFQHDIKKIVAYSTASQLGLIFITLGTLKFNLALFHVFNHAFFKALLFILAGIIIHKLFNNQDLRNVFYLKDNIFLIYAALIIASLTLIGFPFLSAFYSKDFIINYSFINININKNAVIFFLNISVITTFLYSFKIINFLFFNEQINIFSNVYKIYKKNLEVHLFEKDWFLSLIVYILALFCIFPGYVYSTFFQNEFLTFPSNIFIIAQMERAYSFNFLEISGFIILFVILFSIPVLFFRFLIVKFNMIFSEYWKVFYFFNKKTLFDNLYNYFTKIFFSSLNIKAMILDKHIIEYTIISVANFNAILIRYVKNLYMNLKWYNYAMLLFSIVSNACLFLFVPNLIFFAIIVLYISLPYYKFINIFFDKKNKNEKFK